MTAPRPLQLIALELNTHILTALSRNPPHVPAWITWSRPYVSAMRHLDSITSRYYAETGYEVVLRALEALHSWRGVDARRIKNELREHLEACPESAKRWNFNHKEPEA